MRAIIWFLYFSSIPSINKFIVFVSIIPFCLQQISSLWFHNTIQNTCVMIPSLWFQSWFHFFLENGQFNVYQKKCFKIKRFCKQIRTKKLVMKIAKISGQRTCSNLSKLLNHKLNLINTIIKYIIPEQSSFKLSETSSMAISPA